MKDPWNPHSEAAQALAVAVSAAARTERPVRKAAGLHSEVADDMSRTARIELEADQALHLVVDWLAGVTATPRSTSEIARACSLRRNRTERALLEAVAQGLVVRKDVVKPWGKGFMRLWTVPRAA